MVFLPPLTGSLECKATAVSADGVVVVGNCRGTNPSVSLPVRWPSAGGPATLDFPGFAESGDVSAANVNGSVLAGFVRTVSTSLNNACFWRVGSGMVVIAHPPDVTSSAASAISADGRVVVGTAYFGSTTRPFRWTESSGMQFLEVLPGGTSAGAGGITSDGLRIVGDSEFAPRPPLSIDIVTRAVLWSGGTYTDLGVPSPSTASASASTISSDGTTIAGSSSAGPWTRTAGTYQFLSDQLAELGADLGGWRLETISALSANGKILVGSGFRIDHYEGWLAVLP